MPSYYVHGRSSATVASSSFTASLAAFLNRIPGDKIGISLKEVHVAFLSDAGSAKQISIHASVTAPYIYGAENETANIGGTVLHTISLSGTSGVTSTPASAKAFAYTGVALEAPKLIINKAELMSNNQQITVSVSDIAVLNDSAANVTAVFIQGILELEEVA